MTKVTNGLDRECNSCKEVKSLDNYYYDVKRNRNMCKSCTSKYVNARIIKKFGSHRNYNLIQNYGITSEDFDLLYEAQRGLCLICERERNLVVDHSHKTGKVRGLLCSGCNTGIGQFEHDINLFDKAKAYIS